MWLRTVIVYNTEDACACLNTGRVEFTDPVDLTLRDKGQDMAETFKDDITAPSWLEEVLLLQWQGSALRTRSKSRRKVPVSSVSI